MPSRKISNRGSKKNIGKFPSSKMKRTIYWESLIERDLIFLLEYDPEVTSYEEQPDPVTYMLAGKQRHLTPDFFVERGGPTQLIEVKPEAKMKKYAEIFREVRWECRQTGRGEFVVATEKMIRVEPKLGNIKFLFRYARTPILMKHQRLLQDFFNLKGEAPIRELAEYFGSEAVENAAQVVYALVYHGFLEINLMKPIVLDSLAWLPNPGAKN
jgi:hypothetical protein